MRGTAGPETRTTPMPPRPGGVAAATMVSVSVKVAGHEPVTASRGGQRLSGMEHSLAPGS